MTRRSRARDVALQILFERDHNAQPDRAEIERFVDGRLREADLRRFCLSLYDGVIAHLADIDKRLSEAADNWRLPRMSTVDRNALRMGAFELLFCPETPPKVVLDEAIELARRFGAADSPAFVNGVLDRLHRGAEVPAGDATTPPS
jgi:transcription antitermination protein NusB